MFFSGDDDDQDFLSPGGSSKLGSLFGQDQSMSKGGNESLTYTAPKEPKKQKQGDQADSSTTPAVLNAAAVNAFKFTDGSYASQGKLGCAVLGNHPAKDYKILLYRTKQQQITNAKITDSFLFSVQQNNYASFYDDGRNNWSLNFDSEEQLSNFAKQVCLCKYGSSDGAVIVQDLSAGEGGTLENGDSAEIKYTGWLLNGNTFGDVFDTNEKAEKLFRFKFGKGKMIKGWEEGMLGMKKGQKRLIIVPPKLGYGDKGLSPKVPPGATLIFHVEVIRVKLAKDKDSPTSGRASPAGQLEGQPTAEPTTEDDGVKARTKSISEQLQQTSGAQKSDKAKLISRMAKMGQPMLPMSGAVPAQPDEGAEDDDTQSTASAQETPATPTDTKPQKPAKPANISSSNAQPAGTAPASASVPGYPLQAGYPYQQDFQPMMAQPGMQPMMAQPMVPGGPHPSVFQGVPAASQLALYQSPQQFQQQFQPPGYQQLGPQTPAAPIANNDSSLPVLLTESRSHNSEVRLALTKVQDKIDTMSQKFDQTFGGGLGLNPTMETSVLMHNIQRIVQENERMKRELFEKSAKLEAQNEKIGELLQRNQQYVEQSHVLLEQRNDAFKSTAASSQSKVLSLEQEKVQLATELSATTAKLTTIQLEVSNLNKREAELQKQMEMSTSSGNQSKHEINELKTQNTDLENQIAELSSSLKVERQGRKTAESKISTLEDEIMELKSSTSSLEKTLADRKKRAAHEKEQLEQELEEAKSQHEKEVTDLKDKIRKLKTSSDSATAEQVSHIEQELENTWQEKLDRMLASANDRHQRALSDLQEEKTSLEAKIQEMQDKFADFRASRGDSDRQTMELQEELEEMKIWKTKYENIRTQATTMKQRYEDRIQELEGEKDAVQQTRDKLREQAKQLQIALQKANVEVETATAAAAVAGGAVSGKMDRSAVTGEVKKIINTVYQQMRGEFETDETYQGSEVHNVILSTIKDVTLKMLNPKVEEEEDDDEEDTEEGAVVEEEIEATSAVMSQAKAPAVADAGKKSDNKSDDDSDLFKETGAPETSDEVIAPKSSVPAGDKGNPTMTKQLNQLAAKGVEETISSSHNTALGDRGNPQVSKELDKLAAQGVEECISASHNTALGDKGNPQVTKELDKLASGAIGESITASHNTALGDKGNPSVTKALDKLAPTEEIISAAQNTALGDKGNPQVTKELDKLACVEEPIAASKNAALGDRGNPQVTQELDALAIQGVEELIQASHNTALGDRGNPGITEHFDELASRVEEEIIPSRTATALGDRGNPEVTKELNALAVQGVEELIQASHNTAIGDRGNPEVTKQLDKLAVQGAEESISASKNTALGDKGNPYVTKDLDKLEQADEVNGKETISASHSTPMGDKGNPDVMKQLDKLDEPNDQDKHTQPSPENNTEIGDDNSEQAETKETTAEIVETLKGDLETAEEIVDPVEDIIKARDDITTRVEPDIEPVGEFKETDSEREADKEPEAEIDKHQSEINSDNNAEAMENNEIKDTAVLGHLDDDPFGNVEEEDAFFKPEPPVSVASGNEDEDEDGESNEELEKSGAAEKKASPTVSDPLFSGELNGSASGNSKSVKTSVAAESGEDPLFSGSTSKSASKTDAKKKSTTSSSKPLFDEDDSKPLFGEDDNVADTLGINFTNDKKEESLKKSDAKKTASDSDEDYKGKAPPPPLFGDDDDDDDLDWLS